MVDEQEYTLSGPHPPHHSATVLRKWWVFCGHCGWTLVNILSSPGHHHSHVPADLVLGSIMDPGFLEILPPGPLLTLLPQRGDGGCEGPLGPLVRTSSSTPMTGAVPYSLRPCIYSTSYSEHLSKNSDPAPSLHVWSSVLSSHAAVLPGRLIPGPAQAAAVSAARLLPLSQAPPSFVPWAPEASSRQHGRARASLGNPSNCGTAAASGTREHHTRSSCTCFP